MVKESLAQKRFFETLYKFEEAQSSSDLDMELEEDRSRYGLSSYLTELADVEMMPSRNAVKPFLKEPEKESNDFVLSLRTVLEENPKLIDLMTEQKLKISSKDVPDPEAGKPFRSESGDAWDKAIKKHIISCSNQQKIASQIAARRARTA